MKTKITSVIILLIMISFISVKANASSDFDKAMLKAKKNLKAAMNKSDAAQLTKVRGEFERILQLKEKTWLVNYYIALSDYGLATASVIKEDNAGLKKYTQSGIDVINKSIDEYPEFADSFVLLEALNFNRWQYEQEKMHRRIFQALELQHPLRRRMLRVYKSLTFRSASEVSDYSYQA